MRIRLVVGLLAVVGTLFASAGVAAANPKLFITKAGAPVPAGTQMAVKLEESGPGECFVAEEGPLTQNEKSTDKIALNTVAASGCASASPGYTGTLGTLSLTWTGKAKFTKSKLFFHTAGPCVYRALDLESEYASLSSTTAVGRASGWLQRNVSSVNRTQLISLPFNVKVFVEEASFPNLVSFEAIG